MAKQEKKTHDRDMIWKTVTGVEVKIRDLNSDHLTNIETFLRKRKEPCIEAWGNRKYEIVCFNIKQELRLRKLNRLANPDTTELF
jgi:hypothetical protein